MLTNQQLKNRLNDWADALHRGGFDGVGVKRENSIWRVMQYGPEGACIPGAPVVREIQFTQEVEDINAAVWSLNTPQHRPFLFVILIRYGFEPPGMVLPSHDRGAKSCARVLGISESQYNDRLKQARRWIMTCVVGIELERERAARRRSEEVTVQSILARL